MMDFFWLIFVMGWLLGTTKPGRLTGRINLFSFQLQNDDSINHAGKNKLQMAGLGIMQCHSQLMMYSLKNNEPDGMAWKRGGNG
jgi:hypothetical protein